MGQLFKAVLAEHQAKLAFYADCERQTPTMHRRSIMLEELAQGEAYRQLSKQGADAQLDPRRQSQLHAAGHDTGFVRMVIEHIERLRNSDGSIKFSQKRLREHVAPVNGDASAANMTRAQPVYLRALGEALLQAEIRYGDEPDQGLDFDSLIMENLRPTHEAAIDAVDTEPGLAPVVTTPPSEHTNETLGEIKSLARRLETKRVQDGDWDGKTARQARFIFTLFDRFMREEHEIGSLLALQQLHLSKFDDFLRSLHVTFGKSTRDPMRTIKEIQALSKREAPKHGTLKGATRNRHLTFLGQLLDFARGDGLAVDRDLWRDQGRQGLAD